MGFSLSSFFGGGGPSGGDRMKQERENVKQAWNIVGDSQAAYGQNRELIKKQFSSNLSSARARMGASGVDTQGMAWQGIMGGMVRKRDEAMDTVKAEEDAFKQGTSYKLAKKDFRLMGEMFDREVGYTGQHGGSTIRDALNVIKTSKENTDYADLMGGVRGYSGGSQKEYQKYVDALRPSFKEYTTYRFGTKKERAAFSDSQTARIEASNIKFDRQVEMRRQESIARNKFARKWEPRGEGRSF